MDIVPDIKPFAESQNKQAEERQAPAEFHFIGSVKKTKGHTLFSYNNKTGEWKQAPLRREAQVGLDGKTVYRTIVAREPDCIYIQALNMKNAIKKWANEIVKYGRRINVVPSDHRGPGTPGR